MLEKINLTPYLDELGYLHDFWPSGLVLAFINSYWMKLSCNVSIALIAQLVKHLTFVPEDPGSNPGAYPFFLVFSFIFLKKLESLDHFLEHLKPLNQTKNL